MNKVKLVYPSALVKLGRAKESRICSQCKKEIKVNEKMIKHSIGIMNVKVYYFHKECVQFI